MEVTREQALAFRVAAQQLGATGRELTGPKALDLGVPDTGADGAMWSLANRGAAVATPGSGDTIGSPGAGASAGATGAGPLVRVWTLRGAPHRYRRGEVAQVAAATAPFSEADAAKRVFDASKPLREAGIPVLDALAEVAAVMADVVRGPRPKGEVSAALTERLPAPYLRHCRPCGAVHCYEQTFRLAALMAGLELRPGTSPPLLEPIAGWRGPAPTVPAHLDVVRGVLRLLGPTTPADVAGYLDAPVRAVRARWPEDGAEVRVDGSVRWVLEEDLAGLAGARPAPDGPLLLAPYDPLLQARDRDLLVTDPQRRRQVWPVLGRPGVVLRGTEVAGLWRPRARGGSLRVALDLWVDMHPDDLAGAAGRLASHRGLRFDGWEPVA